MGLRHTISTGVVKEHPPNKAPAKKVHVATPKYKPNPAFKVEKLTPCEKNQLLREHEVGIAELKKEMDQLKKELEKLKG